MTDIKRCSGCIHAYEEQWAKNHTAQRCGAPGHRCSGWVVNIYPNGKSFLAEERAAPAWCNSFEKK